MAEAARLKGVSYHTVSRAVRRGKLPATRLGRMALISTEDLRDWRPMRERAPRKYRRREPNPEATPALLDLASAERVDLASRLASLYEALHAAIASQGDEKLYDLIAERLAITLGLRRVAVNLLEDGREGPVTVGSYGSPLKVAFDNTRNGRSPLSLDALSGEKAAVKSVSDSGLSTLLVAPIRTEGGVAGLIVGDRNGEEFNLDQGELDLAQALANVVGLSLKDSQVLEGAGV
jgi:excisionase family DNA binding protein